jgi:hypothetical protein
MPFKHADTIIPSTGSYPEDALTVISDDGTTLSAYPESGGFCLSFAGTKREKYNFRLVTERELNSTRYRQGLFTLDVNEEDEPLPGWTTGHRWNGWACPMFSRDTFVKVLKLLGEDYMKWSYNEATDTFTYKCEDDEIENTSKGFDVEGVPERLYSTDGWTWREVQP